MRTLIVLGVAAAFLPPPPPPRRTHLRSEDDGKRFIPSKLNELSKDAEFIEDVRVYLSTLAVCLTIRFFIVEPRYIPSLSMYPTFDIGDQLAVEKITKRSRPLVYNDKTPVHRNEVVVFSPPPAFQAIVSGPARNEALIKRCVAIEGDIVKVQAGKLYINGQPQDEPQINEQPFYDLDPVVVPPGCIFVLGDNRNQSLDSHIWGFLPVKNVIGRAVFKYWPPNRVGAVEVPGINM